MDACRAKKETKHVKRVAKAQAAQERAEMKQEIKEKKAEKAPIKVISNLLIFFSTSFRQNETYAKLHASRSQTRSQNQTACPGGNTLPGNLRKISSMILTVNFQNWNPGDPWRHQWDPKSLRAKLHRALLHKERLERHRKHLQGKNRRTVKKFWDFFYKNF